MVIQPGYFLIIDNNLPTINYKKAELDYYNRRLEEVNYMMQVEKNNPENYVCYQELNLLRLKHKISLNDSIKSWNAFISQ